MIKPFEEAGFMQKREDARDVREAKRILRDNPKFIPYDEVRKKLGLDDATRKVRRSGKAARKSR